MPAYSIELDLRSKTVVVIGLGAVGLRKAAGLVEVDARVVGVDPGSTGIIPGIEVVAEPYRAEHLVGSSPAFAAATAEVNRQVYAAILCVNECWMVVGVHTMGLRDSHLTRDPSIRQIEFY